MQQTLFSRMVKISASCFQSVSSSQPQLQQELPYKGVGSEKSPILSNDLDNKATLKLM